MGEALAELLTFLVTNGPARNPAELARLLGLIEQLGGGQAAAQAPAPEPVPPAPGTQATATGGVWPVQNYNPGGNL